MHKLNNSYSDSFILSYCECESQFEAERLGATNKFRMILNLINDDHNDNSNTNSTKQFL